MKDIGNMAGLTSNCPVCGYDSCSRSYAIKEYTYLFCNACGMLYMGDSEKAVEPGKEQYNADYFKDTVKENMSGYMDYAKQSRPLRMNFRRLL